MRWPTPRHPREVRHRRRPGERHRVGQVAGKPGKQAGDPVGATTRQRPQHRAAKEHRPCSEAKGREHVRAGAQPAVGEHRDGTAQFGGHGSRTLVSIADTSRSTRGISQCCCHADTLARSVCSLPEPPA